jgi:hypothetical protein
MDYRLSRRDRQNFEFVKIQVAPRRLQMILIRPQQQHNCLRNRRMENEMVSNPITSRVEDPVHAEAIETVVAKRQVLVFWTKIWHGSFHLMCTAYLSQEPRNKPNFQFRNHIQDQEMTSPS